MIRVIEPPAPIVVPADVGAATGDQATINMIAAATEEIAAPTGWLNRSLGAQTLELSVGALPSELRLPYLPIIDVLSVEYDDGTIIDPSAYSLRGDVLSGSWPSNGGARITYRAGYNSVPVAQGGTGTVPARAKQAVIIMVNHMRTMAEDDVFATQESVVGVGATMRSVTPYVSQAVRDTVNRLLVNLRVRRLG